MTYIDTHDFPPFGEAVDEGHCWRTFTERRLAWHHGPQRARDMLNGRDPETNKDIAAWRQLGGAA